MALAIYVCQFSSASYAVQVNKKSFITVYRAAYRELELADYAQVIPWN